MHYPYHIVIEHAQYITRTLQNIVEEKDNITAPKILKVRQLSISLNYETGGIFIKIEQIKTKVHCSKLLTLTAVYCPFL